MSHRDRKLLLLLALFPAVILAQPPGGIRERGEIRQFMQEEVTIRGTVNDAADRSPLAGAHVSLRHSRDTTRVFQTTTNTNGEFQLNVPRGRYLATISFVGFQTLVLEGEQSLRAISGVNDLGTFYLYEGSFLDEVEIAGQRVAARLKGDTLDYDARAFRVNPDASAEDLVRRLPGVTVVDGRVTAQGEDVRRVLVDGREFFGDDPSIALRNLPAEVIDRIEIYDRMSDQAELTGFDDGQRSKTINIVTRLDTRSGQFGRLYSGYGADERYQLGLTTNIFMNDSRLSVIGMSNNINEQNFSREDIISLSAGAIRGGRGGGMGGGLGRMAQGGLSGAPQMGHVTDFRVASQQGDNTTHALGLNYSNRWLNDNLNLSGSYFFNLSDNLTDQFADRQYFIDQTGRQNYIENSESSSRNSNHRMNMRLTYDINENNSLVFSPRITLQGNTADSYMNARNFLEGNHLLSMSQTGFDSDLTGYNTGGSMIYRYRPGEGGRTLSTNLSANFNNNQSLNLLDALNDYFSGEGDPAAGEQALSDYLNQRTDSETLNRTLSSNVTWTEPMGDNGLLQLSYNISGTNRETDRITNSWDPVSLSYRHFEAGLSNRLSSNYLTRRGSLGYRLRGDKYNLTMEIGYQHAGLTADQVFPYQFTLRRSFQNILPSAMLTYNIERGKSLRFSYRTSTSPPSVRQLQDVVDNSNPMLVTSGNPDLDHSYSHFFMSRYNSVNTEKSTNFIAFVFGNVSNGYIGNSTLTALRDTTLANGYELRRGSRFTQPVNLDGFATVRSNVTYGFPVRVIKSNLSLSGGISWMRTPGLINGNTNIANTLSMTGGVVVSSNIGPNVDFSASWNTSYSLVENTLQPRLDNNYYYQTTGARFSILFLKNWVFRNDFSHLMYRGLGDGFNDDYILWNMNIGRKLFNNNLGEITFSVFDLLNQNDNIIRNISDSYIEDLRTNQLSRFFMLTFSYNLRHFRTRET
jgi:hypothetical protein